MSENPIPLQAREDRASSSTRGLARSKAAEAQYNARRLAALCGVTGRQLRRRFRQWTGKPVRPWLNEVQLWSSIPLMIDYDGAWKEALELYLEPFLCLCFPVVHAGIDWNCGFEFLDKELQEVVCEAETGKQRVDKLVKVYRRDGIEEWLLVHVEVQSQADRRMAERMYGYHRRIGDRYGRRVVSLAVLGDNRPGFRPGAYEEETWGCRVRFEYPTCKLLDFGVEELEGGDNPIGIVIAAHRSAQTMAGDAEARKRVKWELTRRLYERGYGKRDVVGLFRLIDWLIRLPERQTVAFRQELIEYEQQKHMPYVTSIEELGRQEGRREGRQEGLILARQKDIVDALEVRFGEVPDTICQAIETIQDEVRLRTLHRSAIQAGSMEEFSRLV